MTDTHCKRHEPEIAAALGGIRLPNAGRGQPDVIAGNVAAQLKTWKTLPAWLTTAADQAATDAPPSYVPVVVLTEVRQGRKSRRFRVIDLDEVTA